METPIIETNKRKIAVVADEGSKSFDQTIEEMEKFLGEKIIKGSEANAVVLMIVLREMLKLKTGKQIRFDFGGKKEWEIKRIK